MIYIIKKREPRSLTKYKQDPFAYFNGCPKQSIKQSLFEEQGHLCAYCMRRIQDVSEMTIEHYKPQHPQNTEESNRQDSLNYNNMLGVCLGNRGCEKRLQTCDAHRGNTPLTVDPLNQSSIDKIAYRTNGLIYSDDPAINTDLNVTLNLNFKEGSLIKSRKQAVDNLKQYLLKKQPQGQWSRTLLSKAKVEFSKSTDGAKLEYLGILLFYIEKYLRRCNK